MVEWADLTPTQRDAAAFHDRNIVLTAGAGTGKTTTLAMRYLELLRDDPELTPADIVTITFTNRATAELRDRVRSEVMDHVGGEGGAVDYARWREALDGLDTAYIHTIDSLCARLLREHATEAPLEPGFVVLDDAEASRLRQTSIATYLAENAGDDHELDLLARLFNRYADPRGELAEVLADLLADRGASRRWAEGVAGLSEGEYLRRLFDRIEEVVPELAAFDAATASELLGTEPVQEAFATLLDLRERDLDVDTDVKGVAHLEGELGRVAELASQPDLGESADVEPRMLCARLMPALTSNSGSLYTQARWVTGNASEWEDEPDAYETYQGAVEDLLGALEPYEDALRACPDARDRNAARYVIALARVTREVGERYDRRKADRAAVDFNDLIEGVLALLDEHPRVAERLRDRFEHVMVDEAQDTDPRQWELVRQLSSGGGEFEGRNVFAVGDRKQSIYRFRGADVTTFAHVAERIESANPAGLPDGEGDLESGLRLNFRSLDGILDPLNALFDATFLEPPAPPFEARPQPLDADREDEDDICRKLEYVLVPTNAELRRRRLGPGHPLGTEEAETLSSAEMEATAVAATIEDMLAAGTEVYPEDDEGSDGDGRAEARPASYDDITVLIRDRTWLADYERALREYDIPYTVSSGIGFYGTPEVTALVNLLRVLVDPADDLALYGLLRSPMFGFEDRLLAPLAAGGGLWEAMEESDGELSAVRDDIDRWRRRAGLGELPATVASWSAFLADIVAETGFDVSVAGGPRGNQALANIEKFRDMLRARSGDDTPGLVSILEGLERRREQDAREGQADELGHDDRVELTTVHSAKGEEFPIVIVPGVGRTFRDRAAIAGGKVEFERIGADREPMLGLKAPDPEGTHRLASTAARRVVGDRRAAEERAEEKRTLYVACTRARDQLVLVGHHDSSDIEDGLVGIKGADPDEARSWRDWVQDALLPTDLLAELNRRNGVLWDLGHVDDSYAEVEYRIRLPPAVFPPEDGDADLDLPALAIEGLSVDDDRRFRITPSSVPELLDEPYGEARIVADGRTVVYESTDVGDEGPLAAGDEPVEEGDEGLPANVLGDMVHKLAELRPPDDDTRLDLAEQRLLTEPGDQDLPEEEQERILTHATRAIDFIQGYESGLDMEQVYDELTVTCRFEDGELTGDIDHLIVTPETYHIVDYKTGRIAPGTVEEKAAHLQRQLAIYAIALHQSDPHRAVHTTLCFTGLDEEELRGQTVRYSPAGLDALARSYRREIWDALEGLLEG